MSLRLLRLLIALYAIGMSARFFLARTSLAGLWQFQLLQVFDPWLYLPVPILALIALLARDWRSGAWLAIPCVIFASQYGQLFLPHSVTYQGPAVRVMTANIEYENPDSAALAQTIQRERPDVVALQELGDRMSRPLGDRLRQDYPYQALHPRSDSRGMGILSRYPILEEKPPEMGPQQCGCQQVAISVNGQRVTVLSIHPEAPRIAAKKQGPIVVPTWFSTAEQQQVVLAVRQRAARVSTPLLIMGDMNTTDHEPAYRVLGDAYHDTYREVGWGFGFTFPSAEKDVAWARPFIRIDYIFHDDAWEARSAQVVIVPGSDHNGVVAELGLRR